MTTKSILKKKVNKLKVRKSIRKPLNLTTIKKRSLLMINRNSRTVYLPLTIKVLRRIKICKMEKWTRKRNLNNLINLKKTPRWKRDTFKMLRTNKTIHSR
jgi:hypothetical protein